MNLNAVTTTTHTIPRRECANVFTTRVSLLLADSTLIPSHFTRVYAPRAVPLRPAGTERLGKHAAGDVRSEDVSLP